MLAVLFLPPYSCYTGLAFVLSDFCTLCSMYIHTKEISDVSSPSYIGELMHITFFKKCFSWILVITSRFYFQCKNF